MITFNSVFSTKVFSHRKYYTDSRGISNHSKIHHTSICIQQRSMNYWNNRFQEERKKEKRKIKNKKKEGKGSKKKKKKEKENVEQGCLVVCFPRRRRAIRFSASCSYSIFFCPSILELFFSLASLYTHTDGKNAHATERKGEHSFVYSHWNFPSTSPFCLLAFFRFLFFFLSFSPSLLPSIAFRT